MITVLTVYNGTKNPFSTIVQHDLKVQKGFSVLLPNLYHSTVPKIFSVLLKNNNSMVQKGVLVPFGTLKHVHIYFPFPLDHPLPAAVPVDAIHILQHISIVLTVFPSDIPQILMKMSPNFEFLSK